MAHRGRSPSEVTLDVSGAVGGGARGSGAAGGGRKRGYFELGGDVPVPSAGAGGGGCCAAAAGWARRSPRLACAAGAVSAALLVLGVTLAVLWPVPPDRVVVCSLELCAAVGAEPGEGCARRLEEEALANRTLTGDGVLLVHNPNRLGASLGAGWTLGLSWADAGSDLLVECAGTGGVDAPAKSWAEARGRCVVRLTPEMGAALAAYMDGETLDVRMAFSGDVTAMGVTVGVSSTTGVALELGYRLGDATVTTTGGGVAITGAGGGAEGGGGDGGGGIVSWGGVEGCGGQVDISVLAPSVFLCDLWADEAWAQDAGDCPTSYSLVDWGSSLIGTAFGTNDCVDALAEVKVEAELGVTNPSSLGLRVESMVLEVREAGETAVLGVGTLLKPLTIAPHSNATVHLAINVPLGLTGSARMLGILADLNSGTLELELDGFTTVEVLGLELSIDIPRVVFPVAVSSGEGAAGSGEEADEASLEDYLRDGLCMCIFGECDGVDRAASANNTLRTRRHPGASCWYDSQCDSGSCDDFLCAAAGQTKLATGQACVFDSECASGHCSIVTNECAGASERAEGERCTTAGDCASGSCDEDTLTCAASSTAPPAYSDTGDWCMFSESCQSGECSWTFRCT